MSDPFPKEQNAIDWMEARIAQLEQENKRLTNDWHETLAIGVRLDKENQTLKRQLAEAREFVDKAAFALTRQVEDVVWCDWCSQPEKVCGCFVAKLRIWLAANPEGTDEYKITPDFIEDAINES